MTSAGDLLESGGSLITERSEDAVSLRAPASALARVLKSVIVTMSDEVHIGRRVAGGSGAV